MTTTFTRAPAPATTRRSLRVGGVAGMLLYPVFAVTVVLLTWAEWDFLHGLGWTVVHPDKVNYPSSLALGDLGAVQSLNFVVLGVLALAFARGLRTQFVQPRAGAVATLALLAVTAAGALTAFPTDLPGESPSWHGWLHGLGFLLFMVGNLAASVAGGLALRGARGWQHFWLYSLLNAPAAVVVAVVLSPFDQVSFYALVTVMLTWYAVLGLRMFQLGGRTGARAA